MARLRVFPCASVFCKDSVRLVLWYVMGCVMRVHTYFLATHNLSNACWYHFGRACIYTSAVYTGRLQSSAVYTL